MITAVSAADIRLSASIDKNKGTVEDTFLLTITVSGTRSASRPVVPPVDGLNIQYTGSSSQVKIINSSMTSSVSYNFVIFPVRVGDFTIGPAYMDHSGKRIKTQPVKIKVVSPKEQYHEDEALFFKAQISNPNPYYNQQIIYTLLFGRRVEIAGAKLDDVQFKDFWVEELDKQNQYYQVIGGEKYKITEVKMALFPSKEGKLTIEPAALRCEVVVKSSRRRPHLFNDFFDDPFFSRKRTTVKILRSNPLEINVKPLPEIGKPQDFYPLVGKIKLNTDISKTNLKQGESTTITLEIIGDANIRDARLSLPDNLDNFKIYDDKPIVNILEKENIVIGQKTFKKAIVPQASGSINLPDFKVAYFDPQDKKYKFAKTPAIKLNVTKSKEEEKLHSIGLSAGPAVEKENIKVLAHDIIPIYTELNALEDQSVKGRESILYVVLFLAPGILFLIVCSLKWYKGKQVAQSDLLRRKNAYKNAVKSFKGLDLLLKDNKCAEFYAQLANITKQYLGDKLGLAGMSLTPQEIQAKLKAANLPQDIISNIGKLMQECEFCQFASNKSNQNECKTVYKNMSNLLKQLDNLL